MASARKTTSLPIVCVHAEKLEDAPLSKVQKAWAKGQGFNGQAGRLVPMPDDAGNNAGYMFGLGAADQPLGLRMGLAATAAQPGTYRLEGKIDDADMAALGFLLGTYQFDQFKPGKDPVKLLAPDGAEMDAAERIKTMAFIARDLINTPANILGPDAFEDYIRAFAKKRKMSVSAIVGDALLTKNFPMVHAVGRASAEAPRLLDLSWGAKSAPKVTLVGKGVTYDTGGLDIKPSPSMALMKKDMGGAANVLGLAHAIIDAKLNVRLRVIIPVVENAISGNSFRTSDVLPSRAGMQVEIGNTDAEGRLILADALTLADEETPEMLIDMATLTGAARVALGAELVPVYTSDDGFADALYQAGVAFHDPIWRMPLWAPYDNRLASAIADVNHISTGGQAGSITAALFLQRFVKQAKTWAHFDIYGWALEPRAGYAKGGADQAIRAIYKVLKQRYG